jgi:hypothetical protein
MVGETQRVMTPDNAQSFAGLNIVKTRTVVNRGLCMGLFGGGGAGKTTIAASILQSEFSPRVLHCDAEGGASAIAHLDVDTARITSWSEAQRIGAEFRKAKLGDTPWDTIIWDNTTELQNLNIQSICGDAPPEIQQWGKSTSDMLRFTRFWRDLSQAIGINVILVCWDEIEKEESTGIWKRRVCFTKKLQAQYPGIIPFLGHVSPNERDANSRVLSFRPSNKTDAKFRVAPTEAAAKIPLELYVQRDAPVLADILDTIRGGKPWPTAKYAPPARNS